MKTSYCIAIQLFVLQHFFILILTQNGPECGTLGLPKVKSPANLGLVGGVEAVPHQYPWLVSLGFKEKNFNDRSTYYYLHACTGSLITDQWVLTSGLCCTAQLKAEFGKPAPIVVIGAHNLSFAAVEDFKKYVSIERIIPHQKLQFIAILEGETHVPVNDVCLVKLVEPVELNKSSHYGTICLPPLDDLAKNWYDAYKGVLATVAGWGLAHMSDTVSSEVLLKTDQLPIVSMDICLRAYSVSSWQKETFGVTMSCTLEGGRSPCIGDAGAPWMAIPRNGRWTAYGSGSWFAGGPCGDWKHPYMYAQLAHYSEWIWKTIAEN